MKRTRVGSKSNTFCAETSKPSIINVGILGLPSNVDFKLLEPRISKLGIVFGSLPISLFTTFTKEGSNIDKVFKILPVDTLRSSLPEKVVDTPV